MGVIRNVIGVLLILIVAYLLSGNRKEVKNRIPNILVMFVLILVIAFISLRTSLGITILTRISDFFSWLNEQAAVGVDFVFGGIQIEGGASVFFFNVLLPIIFFSALIGILDYLKILPLLMKAIGWLINKLLGVGELEGQYSIMTTMVGQPTVYVTIADQIRNMSGKRLFTFLLVSTSTVSAAMLAAYMEMIPGEYVVVAVLLNIFAAFIISSIINPYDVDEENTIMQENMAHESIGVVNTEARNDSEDVEKVEEVNEIDNPSEAEGEERQNLISVISDYISNGWDMAVSIAATMIGFVALITFLNSGLETIVGISFTEIVGYVFSPVAFLIGVPTEDIVQVGSVMAQKLFTNEFVALSEAGSLAGQISEKSLAMISVYSMSFANLGTLGIIQGGIKSISKSKANEVSGYLGKILVGSILSSLLVAAIVGMFF